METSSIINTLGAGSGIDMAGLARNLSTAQFQARATRLTQRSETLDRQISAAASLKSKIVLLASSLGERVRSGDLSPQPSLSNPAVAALSTQSGASPTGSYALEVTALASSQTLSSPAFASASSPVGAGTLTIRFGALSSGVFTADTGRDAVNVDIPSGATLADAAAAINAKGAGVTVYVANTATGARLMMKGSDGAANAFAVEAIESPTEPGLAQLAWDPNSGAPNRLLKTSADAMFKIDGLEYVSASNVADKAIPGVTLRFQNTNVGAPAQLSFSDPTSSVTTAMQDLTSALNEIAGELKSATDPKSGDLARDGGAQALRKAFGALAGTVIIPGAPAGAPATLSDLGLATERDGSFRLDTARLGAALSTNAKGAAALFTPGLYGVFSTIDRMARNANAVGNPGSIAGSYARYSSQKAKTNEDQAKLTEAQEKLRVQLVSRFASADSRVGASRSTLSFIQNQIDVWSSDRN